MGRDAAWLASLPKPPLNNALVGDVDYARAITDRQLAVWATLRWPAGAQQLPATATGWTREHVRLEVSVPGRGTLLLWLPAADVDRRRDDERAAGPPARGTGQSGSHHAKPPPHGLNHQQ